MLVSSLLALLGNMSGTALASVRSVGTAVTMAFCGLYLHRRGLVDQNAKRTLAVLSQEVTFPLFLFTKIIYCNQDWSNEPCPDVTKSLEDVWVLLIWPIYVVGVGLLVGAIVAYLCDTPKRQIRSVLAACGFSNCTGLPITLLTVVQANFPSTSNLGAVDPTLFLSVFLLVYPVLQWGLGGWLLAPDVVEDDDQNKLSPRSRYGQSSSTTALLRESFRHSVRHNVLNNNDQKIYYDQHRKGLSSADEGLYMTEVDLPAFLAHEEERELLNQSTQSEALQHLELNGTESYQHMLVEATSESRSLQLALETERSKAFDTDSVLQTVRNILDRCLQPPVVGALAGIICAMTPIRGIFVDLVDRNSSAPLQWLFDGLYQIGQTAVPINMMILGCNLSSSQIKQDASIRSDGLLPMRTMVGIVIGKMIVMPIAGILTGFILKNYMWDIPDDISGAFYLVLMIVFLTPTANNVMVMVELSGSGAKEGMAQVIALQYAVAPVILSLTMTIAIGVASGWT